MIGAKDATCRGRLRPASAGRSLQTVEGSVEGSAAAAARSADIALAGGADEAIPTEAAGRFVAAMSGLRPHRGTRARNCRIGNINLRLSQLSVKDNVSDLMRCFYETRPGRCKQSYRRSRCEPCITPQGFWRTAGDRHGGLAVFAVQIREMRWAAFPARAAGPSPDPGPDKTGQTGQAFGRCAGMRRACRA